MPMRSRLPLLVALALALCALPSLHAWAVASCTPCCAEMAGSAPDSGSPCGLDDADCCKVMPAPPVSPVEPVMPPLAAPALASAPIALAPAPALLLARPPTRALASPAPPARLSVVRLL